MAQTSQEIEIKATPKQCYKVVWDFLKYPEFLDDLNDVEVSKKRGNSCEVTYHIKVIKDIQYTLKMKGKPDTTIEWDFVKGDYMKTNHGYWEFEELKKGLTLATYNIDISFGLLVPGTVTKMLVGKNLPAMLKSFKQRIEKK